MSSVDKTVVVNLQDEDNYINRNIPSTYTCQRILIVNDTNQENNGLIHACIVMATEDVRVVDSFNVPNVAGKRFYWFIIYYNLLYMCFL